MRGRDRLVWGPGALCLAGLGGFLAGCRESGVQGCLDLNSKQQYEAAVERCSQVFAREGDPKAGAAVARAQYSLGNQEEALAWVARLAKNADVDPGVWVLAGAVHEQRGELDKAEEAYRRALGPMRAARDEPRLADLLVRLSKVSWRRSRFRASLLFAREALQQAEDAQDRELELRAADALYTVLYTVGDLAGARRALEAAYTRSEGLESARAARLLANRGGLLADEGRLALARRDLEKALALGAGSDDPQFFRAVCLNLTNVCLELGDSEQAARHLAEASKHTEAGKPQPTSVLYYGARVALAQGRPEDALPALTEALAQESDPDWIWDLEYQRGRAEEALGRSAAAAYERSIATVERMRRELALDELKSWLLDRKRQPFEALFLLQARSGRAEAALATAERALARTFLDAFLHTAAAPGAFVAEPGSAASLVRLESLESLLPAMSESPVAAPQPIDRVLSALAGRRALIYFEAGDELWPISVDGGRVRLLTPAPAGEVRRLAGRFLAKPEDARTAEDLGKWLLPPGSLPEKRRTLHVVADGALGNVPFAALRRGGRYLVEDHALVLAPSLSALAVLESRRTGGFLPPLVLADPEGNLPAARAEGVEVARLLRGTAVTGEQAKSAALAMASRARALHLAAHTGLGPRGAWLQLADRRWSASEILARRIGPPLVVLASCSSAVRPGRDMWGSLGAAFLAAGSRAVLANLGSVEDRQARELVLRFYAEGGAVDPAGALARAQRVAIRRGLSPTSWAPFVLFGSDRPLQEIL